MSLEPLTISSLNTLTNHSTIQYATQRPLSTHEDYWTTMENEWSQHADPEATQWMNDYKKQQDELYSVSTKICIIYIKYRNTSITPTIRTLG